MSNLITIEHQLCTEDRARIDRLTAALEAAANLGAVAKITTQDDLQAQLAATMAKAGEFVGTKSPTNATGEQGAPTLTDTPPEEEKPKNEAPAPTATEKKVSQADIKKKFMELSAKGKKAEAKAIILPYASKISEIPDDKCPEIYEKLVALEG